MWVVLCAWCGREALGDVLLSLAADGGVGLGYAACRWRCRRGHFVPLPFPGGLLQLWPQARALMCVARLVLACCLIGQAAASVRHAFVGVQTKAQAVAQKQGTKCLLTACLFETVINARKHIVQGRVHGANTAASRLQHTFKCRQLSSCALDYFTQVCCMWLQFFY